MPHPFQYHTIENFPVPPKPGASWQSVTQLGLPEEKSDDSAHSVITFEGHSAYQEYLKYRVRHETEKDTWLRYSGDERHKAIFIEEFYAYLPPNMSYVLIESTGKSARELLKRIQLNHQGFHYKLREIDLVEFKARGSSIKGGWFRDLDIADVSSAAIFGENVGESDEWERYESKGIISSLVIEFSYRGEPHSVNISSSGAITLYSTYDEAYSLALVEKFNDIVMKFQKEYDPKSRKDSRKTG